MLFRSDSLRMQGLQSLHAHFSTLQRGDALRGGSGSGERGDGRDVAADGGAANRLLVE